MTNDTRQPETRNTRAPQRALLLASLYLLLGGALSLAVAVVCAMLSPLTRSVQLRPEPETPQTLMSYGPPEGWSWAERRGPGLRQHFAAFYLTLGPGVTAPTHKELARADAPWWLKLPDRPVRLSTNDLDQYFQELDAEWNASWPESNRVYQEDFRYCATAAGWPLVCTSATWLPAAEPRQERICGGTLYKWRWPRRATARIIPTAPCWPGLAANTAFYGAAIALIVHGPGLVRTRLRHRRGLCTKCGYNLQGAASPICPECGRNGGCSE